MKEQLFGFARKFTGKYLTEAGSAIDGLAKKKIPVSERRARNLTIACGSVLLTIPFADFVALPLLSEMGKSLAVDRMIIEYYLSKINLNSGLVENIKNLEKSIQTPLMLEGAKAIGWLANRMSEEPQTDFISIARRVTTTLSPLAPVAGYLGVIAADSLGFNSSPNKPIVLSDMVLPWMAKHITALGNKVSHSKP